MNLIQVDPLMLDGVASKMEESNRHFLEQSTTLLQTVETMQSSWSGKDNLSFTASIFKYEPIFKQLYMLCSSYIDFLRQSSANYRSMQEEIASQASQLK